MRKGTTPTIIFTIPFSTSQITMLNIAFAQLDSIIFEKKLADATMQNKQISVTLTETETLKLMHGYPVRMQIRCGIGNDRLASNIMETSVGEILKGGLLS